MLSKIVYQDGSIYKTVMKNYTSYA